MGAVCDKLFNMLSEILQKLSAAELMEPSLRVLVMIAQTQAGMWRRNGYSLLNQVSHCNFVRL